MAASGLEPRDAGKQLGDIQEWWSHLLFLRGQKKKDREDVGSAAPIPPPHPRFHFEHV